MIMRLLVAVGGTLSDPDYGLAGLIFPTCFLTRYANMAPLDFLMFGSSGTGPGGRA